MLAATTAQKRLDDLEAAELQYAILVLYSCARRGVTPSECFDILGEHDDQVALIVRRLVADGFLEPVGEEEGEALLMLAPVMRDLMDAQRTPSARVPRR